VQIPPPQFTSSIQSASLSGRRRPCWATEFGGRYAAPERQGIEVPAIPARLAEKDIRFVLVPPLLPVLCTHLFRSKRSIALEQRGSPLRLCPAFLQSRDRSREELRMVRRHAESFGLLVEGERSALSAIRTQEIAVFSIPVLEGRPVLNLSLFANGRREIP